MTPRTRKPVMIKWVAHQLKPRGVYAFMYILFCSWSAHFWPLSLLPLVSYDPALKADYNKQQISVRLPLGFHTTALNNTYKLHKEDSNTGVYNPALVGDTPVAPPLQPPPMCPGCPPQAILVTMLGGHC